MNIHVPGVAQPPIHTDGKAPPCLPLEWYIVRSAVFEGTSANKKKATEVCAKSEVAKHLHGQGGMYGKLEFLRAISGKALYDICPQKG